MELDFLIVLVLGLYRVWVKINLLDSVTVRNLRVSADIKIEKDLRVSVDIKIGKTHMCHQT